MDVCRICLSPDPVKDVLKIQTDKNMDNKSFIDIIMFCLDVQVSDTKISTKICLKCYRKIISFHKFKTLAMKNDAYLRSQNCELNNGASYKVDNEIKVEIMSISDINEDNVKDEMEIKNEEFMSHDYQSDDELLSVMKKIKYEFVEEETKENEPVKKKKGRPKKPKKDKSDNIEEKRVCDECGLVVRNLKDHMQRHLPDTKRKRFPCNLCEKIFASASAKYKHVKRKHLGIKKHCKVCDKNVVNLKQHVLVMHNSEALPYECIACKRRFITKSRLEVHMLIHTKDRPHACEQCGKRFRTKLTLSMHTRQVHDKEKTHLCQFCSKSFFKKHHLQIHLRSHTKEKPYGCKECGKYFSSSTTLKNHALIHSDVKTFNCTVCDMSFVRSGYLKAHMLSHTKEKRYACQFCNVKFHRSDHRKRHEYTAHKRHLAIETSDT
ncbi:zinc finger protein OZF [Manduca sexta]|uniref:Uncharacterized protein n=1 Tax=Manduca sexta TaxID=7130 RepID=A0A921Z2I6_MANSE|nr:zinc finger protein OZF [Manduca sexta]KAG6450316.1 hypothetical protein O3G_MSEX006536 [Manduca sexta]